MEPISLTLSQGGRPILTTQVRSVIFDDQGRARGAEAATRGTSQGVSTTGRPADTRAREPLPPPTGPGSGFGAEAARSAVASNLPGAIGSTTEGAEVSADGLTDAERDQVEKLRARDAEVRRHEQAHAAVGGQYASAPTYTFQLGPDGRRYAIGGEVKIDVAPVSGDPEATIDKMTVVKAAALAPAEPSAADRRVAALAESQRMEAVAELATLRTEERFEMAVGTSDPGGTPNGNVQGEAEALPPDTRLAEAKDILGRGEDTLPGQELNTAA